MPGPEEKIPLGESIGEIIDRTTKIVHEEIELAKAEMASAAQDLLRGSVAGIVGGVFAFFGLFILLIAFSFLVADAVGAWYPWLGFFIVAFICFAVGGLLAFVALKKIKKGSQLAPTQAIDEAKQTRDALQAEADKDIETIDSTAVEEPAFPKPAPATKPAIDAEVAAADAKAEEAKDELKEAREDADELQLDAKEAKRRAKQEAKEAKEAAKAAKKAEQEAAKAEAIAAKQAEKAQKEADKARAKAEKEAEKNAKKAAKAGDAPAEPEQPAPGEPQRYVAPQPPVQPPAQPQTPPAPPTGEPSPPQTPPAPPNDPTENK